MPHTITEADAHTGPITVPDGADSRSNAAEVVQNIAQALADRTNRFNLHCAFKNLANVFTAGNTFNLMTAFLDNVETFATDGGKGAFVVRTLPTDDTTIVGNKYKVVFSANLGAYYLNCYSGIVSGGGQFLITLNAVWDVSAQRWHKDSTGDAAIALIFDVLSGNAQFCIQHGTGTWTTWAPNDMSLVAGVGLFQTVLVGGNLAAVGTIEASGVITGDAGFISLQDYILPAGKHIKYASLVAQFRRIRIGAGTTPQAVTDVAFDGTKWVVNGVAYTISIPLPELSNQTEIDGVWVRYEASGANGTLELMRSDITDWGVTPAGATPAVTSLGSAILTTTGSGVKTALAATGAESVDHGRFDYWLRITGAAGSNHIIHAAQMTVKMFSPGID